MKSNSRVKTMLYRLISNKTTIVLLVLSVAFLIGILSFEHVYPGDRDFNLGALQLVIISAGLALYIALSKYNENIRLSYMSLFWLIFALYLLIQIFLIDFDYPDEIYLLLGVSIFFFILSTVISNLSNIDKQYLVDGLTSFLILGCLLELLTQLGHLYQLAFLYGDILLPIEYNGRPIGNIGQPNQLAYIYSLGLLASIYKISHLTYTKSWVQHLRIGYYSVAIGLFALGIALTASRGGIILLLFAIVTSSLLFYSEFLARIKALGVFSIVSILGFFFGSYLLAANSQMVTAAARLASGESKPLRLYQLEQSWIIFQQQPVVGIGWGKYSTGVLENALNLPWFIYNSHSHMIFSQIATELGVIGLIIIVVPMLLVIPRRVFKLQYAYQKIALACVLITLLYSLSEYPLWYFVYLTIFVVFFSLIDFKVFNVNFNVVKKYTSVLVLSVMCVYAFFGYKTYMKYSDVATELMTGGDLINIQKNIDSELPVFFGLSKHRNKLLYAMAGTGADNLNIKIELGNKVLSYENSFYFLIKQANYYVLSNDDKSALLLYKKACVYNFAEECNKVEETIASQQQDIHTSILSDFQTWRQSNPDRTGMNIKK